MSERERIAQILALAERGRGAEITDREYMLADVILKQPDPRDERIAELEAEVERLEVNNAKLLSKASCEFIFWECPKCHSQFEDFKGEEPEGGIFCPTCLDRKYTIAGVLQKHSSILNPTQYMWDELKHRVEAAESALQTHLSEHLCLKKHGAGEKPEHFQYGFITISARFYETKNLTAWYHDGAWIEPSSVLAWQIAESEEV